MEKEFKLNIENIKSDLAIEGMGISQEDVNLLERYSNNEINIEDVINTIKGNTRVWEIYMK